jgi:prepilin-type N-terminal cleavage/methylation domain-containing protein
MESDMSKFFSKKGFGLIEVMIAAVVLGFLIVGLTRLQMGNRETILRVRDRDAANFIAQHVLDSISAGGMKALENKCDNNSSDFIVYKSKGDAPDDYNYEYKFEGKNTNVIKKYYKVEVSCVKDKDDKAIASKAEYTTNLTKANDPNAGEEMISRSLEAKVSWKHGNSSSPQSITIARVVK